MLPLVYRLSLCSQIHSDFALVNSKVRGLQPRPQMTFQSHLSELLLSLQGDRPRAVHSSVELALH